MRTVPLVDSIEVWPLVHRIPDGKAYGSSRGAIRTRAATLVMAGKYDPLVPLDIMREATVVAPIPGARLAVLDCGHEIPLEQPQVAAAVMEAFLAGLRS